MGRLTRTSASEKYELIRLVEEFALPVKQKWQIAVHPSYILLRQRLTHLGDGDHVTDGIAYLLGVLLVA